MKLNLRNVGCNDIFHQMGMILKEISEHTEYLVDSFPIPVCDNIRIFNVKLIHSEDYRGYITSKKRYFYGVKVHLISTKNGIPVEFVFIPGEANDVRGLNALPLNLPPGSQLYADAGYTDYNIEDDIEETGEFCLEVMRKNNSKRQDLPWEQYIKQHTRHYIETVFSSITCQFPKFIHTVTYEGFLLKVQAFIFAFTIQKAFI